MRRKGRKRWAAGRKGEGKRFEVLRGLVLFFSKPFLLFKPFKNSNYF
jgi:hypothetical protein